MSLIEDLAKAGLAVGITVSGYVGMIALVNSLRGSNNKAERDFVEAWDSLVKSWQAKAKFKQWLVDSTELADHQKTFKEKWGNYPPSLPIGKIAPKK